MTIGIIRMEVIVDQLRAAGVQARVEQTGGNVATIFAGLGGRDAVVAGPGWFERKEGSRWAGRAWPNEFTVYLVGEAEKGGAGRPAHTDAEAIGLISALAHQQHREGVR